MASEAVEAMLDCLTNSGNFANAASRQHRYGENAALAIENARASMAEGLRCKPKDIIFTSGATEANNLAISGFMSTHCGTKENPCQASTQLLKYIR